ncbi:ABC transporter ATP-binding protein [Luteipulveratus flavus]|uniref:ABC transporter ATP-binding protein n=1 Tax=Luteipulveratus flavus TaxID=3031728 RepID=A0ABT6CAJ5_9MICO|nr:ABC transporter ATP-binding protein [Luteipulveratus sp. YIM 133296]MDF8265913.1 ABC transporter ATP-binding protein [Luteipulveratus sp. YIM 133296]
MTATEFVPPAVDDDAAQVSRLVAQDVSLAYGDRTVLDGLSVQVPPGKVTAIVGANGCGKSTLLRGLARLLKPTSGSILLDGRDIHEQSTRDVAREVGLLPQSPLAPEGITVTELVGRGRHPYHGLFKQWSKADDDAVAHALELTDTLDLAHRPVDELSGGQRQRVWIAMVLAQETGLLLLDEPTSFLDIAHAVEVLDLVTDLNQRGTTVVMVLHDLNLAARYADHLIAMCGGEVLCEGDAASVVTAANVERVFGVRCQIVPDPVSATPLVVPLGRHHV